MDPIQMLDLGFRLLALGDVGGNAHDPAATAQWNFADEPSLAGTGQWASLLVDGMLAGMDPRTLAVPADYDTIQKAFPGAQTPATVAVR